MANDTETAALTAKEWDEGAIDRPDLHVHTDGHLLVAYTPGDRSALAMGADRHALAAIALHGQPSGFTHDDVALLNWHAGMQHSVGLYINEDRLRSIADRIAALLPPHD